MGLWKMWLLSAEFFPLSKHSTNVYGGVWVSMPFLVRTKQNDVNRVVQHNSGWITEIIVGLNNLPIRGKAENKPFSWQGFSLPVSLQATKNPSDKMTTCLSAFTLFSRRKVGVNRHCWERDGTRAGKFSIISPILTFAPKWHRLSYLAKDRQAY